jgi:hypothetical protein
MQYDAKREAWIPAFAGMTAAEAVTQFFYERTPLPMN